MARVGSLPLRRRESPGALYAELKCAIMDAGLLERRYHYYVWRILVSYAFLVLAFALPFVFQQTGATVLAGLLAGFGMVQVGLIGHDAGHLQIFRSPRKNWIVGLLTWNLSLGVAFWYWYDRHTRHHANTNDVERDPDLAGSGLVAYSEAEAKTRRGWSRQFARYQAQLAPLFLVYMLIFALFLQIEGWMYAIRHLPRRRQVIDLAFLILHCALYALPFWILGARWIEVFALSQMTAGLYLCLIVAPNHKGMPVWTNVKQPSYLERQVLSSRNVSAYPLWDFIYGGLNYQIEHHLFPTMPRANFKRAQAIIRPFCLAHGLAYEEVQPWSSFRAVYTELRRVGLAVG